ncbi:hypothetical protein HOLleu_28748 [Holothuria leucospilota]|uniref:Uncharacterized protein n=1 Tax=Holothuria leucospilota TaxID=206669 RepID=A0A9Q1H1P0_HOLLE|nr:hypothetical protein HOLleu_28748 [Holothuria leucospilota]
MSGTNPIDRYGRRSKCAVCESIFHWAKDCPHRDQDSTKPNIAVSNTWLNVTSSIQEEYMPNITSFSKNADDNKNEIFMIESYGEAVLDTACTKTVCGRRWIQEYISKLDGAESELINSVDSSQEFKFGDGATYKSTGDCVIPAVIGDTACQTATEIVECDIPLLLSKDSLKRANTVLDLRNDKATMFEKDGHLEFTSSGHYCVNLLKPSKELEAHRGKENHEAADEILTVDAES